MIDDGISLGGIAPVLRGLIDALNGTDAVAEGGLVDFVADELVVIADVVEDAERVRVRVYLPIDDEEVVRSWVAQQPAPRSGLLEAAYIKQEGWQPRLVFERPLQHDWAGDPLVDEANRYLDAWLDAGSVPLVSAQDHVIYNDPRDAAPASAWLLMGSEESFPTQEVLKAEKLASDVGIFTWHWTTAAQTQFGDLVFFYFTDPRKAIHFVARAASGAYFSRDFEVAADKHANRAQWWGYFTAPIEIEPITVDVLRQAAGGYLPLRGRSGHYLRPEFVRALNVRAIDPGRQAELDKVVQVPVGLDELPDRAAIDHSVWRDLAAGALTREAHVSEYIVEPLLRDSLEGTGLTWTREYPIGRRWADFVILDGERPVHVVEVKKVIRKAPRQAWADSADFTQVRWYADHLKTPSTLIDSHRVLLVKRGGEQPYHEVTRRGSTTDDLTLIRKHIIGS